MLNPNEAALESKCERIARIITRNYGVTVRVEGGQAYYDFASGEIVLPNLNSKQMEQVGNVLDGFLDHECGHSIFTSRAVVQTIKSQSLHYIWNGIEDVWTERAMGNRYPGCAQNLTRLHAAMKGYVEAKWAESNALTKMMYRMSEVWRGSKSLEQVCADPEVGALLAVMGPEIAAGHGIESTAGALTLAKRILERLESLSPPPPPPQPEEGSDESESPEENEEQEGDSPENGPEDQGDADSDEKPLEGSQSTPGGSEGQGKPAAGETPQNGSESAEEPNLESEDDGSENTAGAQAQKVQAQIQVGDFGGALDPEEFLNECLEEVLDMDLRGKHDDPESYLVFSEEFDTEETFDHAARLEWSEVYQALKESLREHIGTLASNLEMALVEETESRWVGGARRGRKFDKRVFPNWFCGGDDSRIFRQLEQGIRWDTAVSLLFDCSGSMGSSSNKHSKAALARLAAVAFHESLLRANIPHEVLGFNTSGGRSEELKLRARAALERGESLDKYSRVDELDGRFVFVPFDEPDGRAICAITGRSSNRDGEAVLWAAKRLAGRKEKRKLLIVVSDGLPAGARHHYTERKFLQEAVQRVINAGIETYAVGIKSKHVKDYYPQSVVIQKSEDLPKVIINELGQAILGRRGTDNGRLAKVARPMR